MNARTLTILLLGCFLFAAESGAEIKKYRVIEDYAAGEAVGVSLRPDGTLVLAPASNLILESALPHIWALTSNGRRVYAGAGSPASVLAFDSDGGDSTTIYRGEEAAVFALAADDRNGLWFAPAPGGSLKYYRNGTVRDIAELEVQYVWDILVRKNDVLVATGAPGLILRATTEGTVDTFYVSDEVHIRTLAAVNQTVYAGSADNGIVYAFDESGTPSVLYDSPVTEIFAIVPAADGSVWAAGTKEGPQLPAPRNPGAGGAAISIEAAGATSAAATRGASAGARSGDQRVGTKGAVFLISKEGFASNLWNGRRDRVQSLAPGADGSVLVGTGEHGRLFTVDRRGEAGLMAQADAAQITDILVQGDAIIVGGANLGKVWRVTPRSTREQGEYLSKVFDAGLATRWGALSWQSEGSVAIMTRSGDSESPDATWSGWRPVARNGAPVESPAARFLQWKATMTRKGGTAPRLQDVAFGYVQRNAAPRVTDVRIFEYGTVYPDAAKANEQRDPFEYRVNKRNDRPKRNAGPGKKETRTGFHSVGWTTDDANKDELRVDIAYRLEGTNAWRPLVKNYIGTVFSWDSRTMPDGAYRLRITASDHVHRTQGDALTGERLAGPLVIDNSPPQILRLRYAGGGQPQVRFDASDAGTPLSEAYYAVDAGPWQPVFPDDSIFDSRAESFQIDVSGLSKGQHTLTVKVFDEHSNEAYGHLEFKK